MFIYVITNNGLGYVNKQHTHKAVANKIIEVLRVFDTKINSYIQAEDCIKRLKTKKKYISAYIHRNYFTDMITFIYL